MTELVKLATVTETIMGQAPSSHDCNKDGTGTPFVKAGEFGLSRPLIKEWTTNPLKFAKYDDVLLCVVGATCGKINKGFDGAIGRSVAAVRAKPEFIDKDYLYYFLQTWSLRLRAMSQGAAQTVITRDMIGNLEIYLPPLAEQRRIASILDQADELRQKRQQAIEKLDQLLQATFIDMFGDPVSNPKGWCSDKNLGDVADIVSGITKGRKITGKSLREIPYLAVSNVQDKYLNLSIIKTIEASDDEIERYKLKQGDLLLTEGGDPDKLGRGTLWNNEVDECIHQNHVFRVRLTSNEFTPNYLNWIVGSEYGKRYFLKSAKQTTGIASINMGQLKKLPLLTPPLDLQIQFDERCIKIHQIKNQLVDSYKDMNNLFSSLQNQAFNGTL